MRLARIAVELDDLASRIPAEWAIDDLAGALAIAQFALAVDAVETALSEVARNSTGAGHAPAA